MTTSPYMPDITVEVAFNAGVQTDPASRTWTDVSSYVELDQGIEIGVGRSDRLASADANTLALVLDNTDGRFTPGNASGAYYPNVKLGRPIRVKATTNGNLVSNSTFETNTTGWSGTGTVPPTLTRSSTVGAQDGAWAMRVAWGTGGTSPIAQANVSVTAGQTYTVSAYAYVPTGDPSIKLGVASLSSGSVMSTKNLWTRLTYTFVAVSSVHTIQVIPNTSPVAGQFAYIDAVMVNAGAGAIDFTTTAPATTTRFQGFVEQWPLEWNGTSSYAVARLRATSRMARLGLDPCQSIIEEEYQVDNALAIYPLSEPEGSTEAADSSGNGVGSAVSIGTGTAIVFGNATGPGTDGYTAATFANGQYLAAPVAASASACGISFTLNAATPATNSVVVNWCDSLAASKVGVTLTSAGLLLAYVTNGSGVNCTSVSSYGDNLTHAATVTWGAGQLLLYVDGSLAASNLGAPGGTIDFAALEIGGASTAAVNFAGTIAEVAVFDSAIGFVRATDYSNAAVTGFAGEAPGTRLARYAGYGSLDATELSAAAGTAPIAHVETNGQSVLELMRRVEETDGGFLFESPAGVVTYLARDVRYLEASAFTLSMATHQVEAAFSPMYDRFGVTNDVVATWSSGEVHATDLTSVDEHGRASTSLTLATSSYDEAHGAAWWRVGTYAQPSPRVPDLAVEVVPFSVAMQNALLGALPGDRFGVIGIPAQASSTTGDYFIEGWTETIGNESLRLTFNVTDAGPYVNTFVLEDATRGKIDDVYRLAY